MSEINVKTCVYFLSVQTLNYVLIDALFTPFINTSPECSDCQQLTPGIGVNRVKCIPK